MIRMHPTTEDPKNSPWRIFQSLQIRLLVGTISASLVALVLAGFVLGGLFKEHVQTQFQTGLTQQLDQLIAKLEFDSAGRPVIDSQTLSDPRWQHVYSGLYWQIDEISLDGLSRTGVLRSRSLWDSNLQLNTDSLTDGALHVHEILGPQDSTLLLLERTVRTVEQSTARWRLIVAGDLKDTRDAVQRFTNVLVVSLAVLFFLLVLAAWAQVAVGLKPLRQLQHSLKQVQQANSTRLLGVFPTEVQPLVDDFNRVLEQNHQVLERARTQAGNLAHALKTPLSVLDQAASLELKKNTSELARQVQEQVISARRHIDWHLARARVSATQRLPGQRTDVAIVLAGLVRVMERVHATREISIETKIPDLPLYFAGEEMDLQEMLGNLLDNACKWAQSRIKVTVDLIPNIQPPEFLVTIMDDGLGIDDKQVSAVMRRGVRLDESVPGTGLGLAITQELASLYGGQLILKRLDTGGVSATLQLPAT